MPQAFIEKEAIARLCAMASEQGGIDLTAVEPDSDFINDLNFDSLDVVEYVMKIEDEFNVSIDDSLAEKARTPRQAYEMLKPLLAEASCNSEQEGNSG